MYIQLDKRRVTDAAEAVNLFRLDDENVTRASFEFLSIDVPETAAFSHELDFIVGMAMRARTTPRHYGPEKPTGTPPGSRTTAIVTPFITRVGGTISSAPSRSASSKAALVSATWTEKLLPGASDELIARIPPPPVSEYANRW